MTTGRKSLRSSAAEGLENVGKNHIGNGQKMIPIRCFTCGAVISIYWDEFKERMNAGESVQVVLDDLGIMRYCCRRMLLTHKELVDVLAPYQ